MDAMTAWLAYLRNGSPTVRGAAVAALALAACAVVAPAAIGLGGIWGLAAAAAAAGLCLAGALAALAASHAFAGPRHALAGLLVAMAARTGIPLGFGLACHLCGGPLAEAGLLYYLLVFYPPILLVETYLSLPQHPRGSCKSSANRDAAS